MTVGDVAAQWMEHKQMQRQEQQESTRDNTTSRRAVRIQARKTVHQYRQYGHLSPDEQALQHELHEQHQRHEQEHEQQSMSPWIVITRQRIADSMSEQRLAWQSYDGFRTATMVTWATCVYTPYFLHLFGLYERYLPKTSSSFSSWSNIYRHAALRAVLTFTASIPLTAAFFAYGCTVHYLTEHLENESNHDAKNTITSTRLPLPLSPRVTAGICSDTVAVDTAIPSNSLPTTIGLKLRAELLSTVQTGALLWIPVNVGNFALVPPHMRPMALMSVSVLWNAHLSMAQHRPVVVVFDKDDKVQEEEQQPAKKQAAVPTSPR